MASGLVLVDKALIRRPVNGRNRLFVSFGGAIFVAGRDRVYHLFDFGAHGATARGVVLAMLFSLTCALAGLY